MVRSRTGRTNRALPSGYFEADRGMGSTVKVGSLVGAYLAGAAKSIFLRSILSVFARLTHAVDGVIAVGRSRSARAGETMDHGIKKPTGNVRMRGSR